LTSPLLVPATALLLVGCPGRTPEGNGPTREEPGQESRVPRPSAPGLAPSLSEADWQTGADPQAMLDALGGRASDRKLRLFACACCRDVWPFLRDERSRKAVEAAERYADEEATLAEMEAAGDAAGASSALAVQAGDRDGEAAAHAAVWATARDATTAAHVASRFARRATTRDEARGVWVGARPEDERRQAALLRDLLGNPFRPVRLDTSWKTPEVLALARRVYDERAFDRLPELAAALERAGCSEAAVLDACRRPGPHARGSWLVDALLDRT
jgi:hypothetical protein